MTRTLARAILVLVLGCGSGGGSAPDAGPADAADECAGEGWSRQAIDPDDPHSGPYLSLRAPPSGGLALGYRKAASHGSFAYAIHDGDRWSLELTIPPQVGGDIDYVAIDRQGETTHAAFYDIARGELQYASFVTPAEVQLESVATPQTFGVALAVDGAGVPWIAYREVVPPSEELRLAGRSAGDWSAEPADADGAWPALVLDAEDTPHIAHGRFRVSYVTRSGDGSWSSEDVDQGARPAIALGPDGEVHVAYDAAGGPPDEVRHAVRAGGAWIGGTIDAAAAELDGAGAWGAAIAVDPGGTPHVSYYLRADPANSRLVEVRYATRDGDTWHIETVDAAEISSRHHQSAIAIDPAGAVHIVYYDGQLRHAARPPACPAR